MVWAGVRPYLVTIKRESTNDRYHGGCTATQELQQRSSTMTHQPANKLVPSKEGSGTGKAVSMPIFKNPKNGHPSPEGPLSFDPLALLSKNLAGYRLQLRWPGLP